MVSSDTAVRPQKVSEGENPSPMNEAAGRYFRAPSDDSMSAVISAGEGLVRKYARIYGGGCGIDDLFQAGCEGILKALRNFDASRGVSFVTYASHFIIGEIRHMVRKEMSYYRPGCIKGLQSRVYSIVEDYAQEHGAPPDPEFISERLGVREESVDEVMKAGIISMDDINIDAIKSNAYSSFQLPLEDRIYLEQAFKKLNEIQKKVIELLFYTDLTQIQVAKKLGLTQRQVSRIKEKSILEMKKDAEDR